MTVVRVRCPPAHARRLAARASAMDEFEIAAALQILADDVEGYARALMAHHEISTLSRDALRESLGGTCQICARATIRDDRV